MNQATSRPVYQASVSRFRCCGLLLQRFAQLVEQACVLDGDDGLRGEVCYQLDLLVGEGAYLLAVYANSADKLVLLEHRDDEKRASAAEVGKGDSRWIAIEIIPPSPNVL